MLTGMVPNNGDKLKGKSIMVANGKMEVTSLNGSINRQMIDKKGMEVTILELQGRKEPVESTSKYEDQGLI